MILLNTREELDEKTMKFAFPKNKKKLMFPINVDTDQFCSVHVNGFYLDDLPFHLI